MRSRIKHVRQRYGLTQAQFATRLKLSQNYIALIESGKRDPSERTVLDICREFGVSESWLKNGGAETDMLAPNDRDSVTQAFGELAARKDPIIDGFVLFLRSRTPEQLELIAQQMEECVEILRKSKEKRG